MERGSDKHSARQDDALRSELEGMLGHGGHREEAYDPEPPADGDDRPDLSPDEAVAREDERLRRVQHDLSVANDADTGRVGRTDRG